MTVSPADLSATIRAVAADWLAAGKVSTIRYIGNGLCEDFAEAVMDRLGVAGHGSGWMPSDSQGRLIDCVTDDWWARVLKEDGSDAGEAECFVIDVARLRAEGAPLPAWLRDDDQDAAQFLGSATHNWLVLDGRHYDATCPDGADHFLEMPFFADQIARYGAERHPEAVPA